MRIGLKKKQAHRNQVFRHSFSVSDQLTSAQSRSWSLSLAVSPRPQRNERLPKQPPLGGRPPQDRPGKGNDIEMTSPTESLDNRPAVDLRLGLQFPRNLERLGLTWADGVDRTVGVMQPHDP